MNETKYPRSSSFYAYDNCPASYQLSKQSGEEPATPYSESGSAIHLWLARGEREVSLEESELETAKDLQRQEEDLLFRWHGSPEIPLEIHREERLWLRDGLLPVYSGKPDTWYVVEDRVLLLDYKSGWHPLDHWVATNCQLRSYVPLIDEALDGRLETVTMGILKPGAKSPPALYERIEIDEARAWAFMVAKRSTAPGAKVPNKGEWCKYCSGKVLCPLWRTEIEEISDLATARIGDISDRALARLAPRLETAAMVIKKLEERLYVRARAHPERYPDWRFEPGANKRSVSAMDIAQIHEKLVSHKGDLSFTEFMECCRLSLPDLEKMIRLNRHMSTRDIILYLDKEIGNLVQSKSNKDKLVYDPQSTNEIPEPAKLEGTTQTSEATAGGAGTGPDETGRESQSGSLEQGAGA